MTGKEMGLVLIAMALAAGGAGVGVAVATSGGPAAVDHSAEILERLDDLEGKLDQGSTEQRLQGRKLENLADRLTDVERGLEKASDRVAQVEASEGIAFGGFEADPDDAGTANGGARRVRRPAIRFGGPGGTELPEEIRKALESGDAPGRVDIAELGERLSEALGGTGIQGMLARAQRAEELRRLPESERWTKAQDELGLGWNQVEELKAATAERDAAMKEALQVERDETTDDGGRFRMQRLDREKARTAQEQYKKRVGTSLNEDQRKAWDDKGYSSAFGDRHAGAGGGGATVISVSTSTSVPGFGIDVEEEDK